MGKRLVYFGITFVMLFSVAGLFACDLGNDFASYKTTAKTALQNHADAKLQANDYSAEALTDIAVIVTNGKAAITDATDKPAVDAAKADAIQAINDVPQKEENVGTFYSLQEAYDEGLFTVQDLMSIAYYHDSLGGVDGTFIPTPKNPEVLNAETSNEICQAFFKMYIEPNNDESNNYSTIVTIDEVEILVYYGTYNDAVVFRMKANYVTPGAIREVIVGGITFTYNSGNDIFIWIKN